MRRYRIDFWKHAANSLRHDTRGVVLPLFAIMAVILIVVAGAAVDFSRAIIQREKLSYALDAAALSVATDLSVTVMTDDEIKTALENSLKANLAGEPYLNDAIANLVYDVDPENGTIDVDTNVSVDTYFISMGGYGLNSIGPSNLGIGTGSSVAYSQFDVELALVVDVTGSMASDMDTLREASEDVVDILIPDSVAEADSKVRISLVPYSQGVNLGSYADLVKGDAYGYSDGSNCVTERQNYNDGTTNYQVKYTDDAYNYYTKTSPPPARTFFGGGSNSCSSDSVMIPLTANRTTLIDAIQDLDDGGGTAGQTGIAWGWYSLSPNFSNVWPSDSAPTAYTDEDVLKFAIIMTDGDNNRHYDYKQVCYWWSGCYWTWDEDSDSGYNGDSSKRSRSLCEAMKTAGIEIFGVYFGSNNNSTGAKNMQACASTGNYYQASSSSALINAFGNIAKKIQSIYVSG